MIIADSSAWIEFIKRPDDGLGAVVRDLLRNNGLALMGIVLIEVVRGLRSGEAEELEDLLNAVPFVETTKQTWTRAGRIARTLEERGERVPLGDIVVAATALEGGHTVLTRDKHFERIPGLPLYDWKGNTDA